MKNQRLAALLLAVFGIWILSSGNKLVAQGEQGSPKDEEVSKALPDKKELASKADGKKEPDQAQTPTEAQPVDAAKSIYYHLKNSENSNTQGYVSSTFLSIGSGLFVTLLLGLYTTRMNERLKKFQPQTGTELWRRLGGSEAEREMTRRLGLLEQGLFFASFVVGEYILIGAMLAFKLASKWQVWQQIVKVPEKLDYIYGFDNTLDGINNELDYFLFRNWWATQTSSRFIIGTFCNLLAAFIGSLVEKWVKGEA